MMKYLSILLLLALFCVGCNRQVGVSGTVKFADGKPLTNGTVIFAKPLFMASGSLDANGHYTLGAFKAGDGTQKGEYSVYITGADKPAEKEGDESTPLIDAKFTGPDSSGLKCKVNGATTFDITVTPPVEAKK